MLSTQKTVPALLIIFLTACQSLPGQPASAQALAKQAPYRTGVEIAKPTYTPSPLPTVTFTPVPTATALPLQTPSPATFSATDFVVLENRPALIIEPALSTGYTGNKSILVVISEQHLYAYEGETPVFSFVASTGMGNSTRIGHFSVLEKIPNAYGATWNIWMPYWLGIYWSGNLQNGIHALPILPNGAMLWAGYLGTPISYGCVVLGSYEAQLLYEWAEVGTPVEIRR